MTAARVGPDGPVLGFVDGEAVSAQRLESRLSLLHQGNRSSSLPFEGTREGRQFRRWLAQVVLTEALLAAECRRRALSPEPGALADLDGVGRVELGSVDATALASSAAARAVYLAVTAGVSAPGDEVEEYRRRYAARYHRPERRVVRHVLGAEVATLELSAGARIEVRRGDLPSTVDDLVFGAEPGAPLDPVRSELGWHLVRVEAVHPAEQPDSDRLRSLVLAELGPGSRRRHYRSWLDGRRAAAQRVSPGYEHPADPRQPDHLHQH